MFRQKSKNKEKKKQSNLRVAIEAIILALLVRSLLFEPFHIPSGSMKSGLLEGDFIIVSKFSYGYSKYSFPLGLMPIKERVFANKPERGDVVVFRLPTNTRINYIKRLIGLPGDKIQVIDGVLYVNNLEVAQKDAGVFIDNDGAIIKQYKETLASGRSYNILDKITNSRVDNTAIYDVPAEHYFFMGDNRDNSQDSRFLTKVGFVAEKNLVGEAKFIFMSSRDKLLKFWLWHKNIRFNRIFKKIE